MTLKKPRVMPRLLLGAAFFTYLTGTVFLYFWGPWNFPMPDGVGPLIGFLAAVHVLFAAGYLLGIRGTAVRVGMPIGVNRIVLLASLAEIVLLFPSSFLNTGSWFPRPWAAMQDLGGAYSASLTIRDLATPYVNYARMLLSPLLAVAMPLGVVFWADLSRITRIVFVVSVVGTIALFMAMGANVGLGQWLAFFPWFALTGILSGKLPPSRRTFVTVGLLMVLSTVVFAAFFAATMAQRRGSYASSGVIGGLDVRTDSAVAQQEAAARTSASASAPIPERSRARIGAEGFAAYFTQGYYAVYLSMQERFVPCYGVGNSVFLQRQVVRLTGNVAILECPYPKRIEHRGWRAEVLWASLYPWVASDVTFPGVVLVMGVIGWLAGRVWRDAVDGADPFAVALLGQLLVLLYYIPAHNKVMHSGEGLFAFGVLLLAWACTRRSGIPAGE